MNTQSEITCCFSGYRIEKMPFRADDTQAVAALNASLEQAIIEAASKGYRRFLSGMSTGFDLWAAEAVLRLQKQFNLQLLCAVPFDGQAAYFPAEWKQSFNHCLLAAARVFSLAPRYYAGCFAARNRFMVDASSLLICYFDGQAGGTAQTVHMAQKRGLEIINLADYQLSLSDWAATE